MWTSSMLMGAGKPAILRVGSSKATATSGTSLSVSKPSGVQNDDVMIAVCSNSLASANVWTMPSGWTELFDNSGLGVAVKTAASEGSSYSFTTSTSPSGLSVAIVAYRNAVYDLIGSRGISAAAPSITLTTDDSVLLAGFISAGATTYGAPTGMSAIETVTTAPALGLFEQLLMPTGATGTRSPSSGSISSSILIGLKPAS